MNLKRSWSRWRAKVRTAKARAKAPKAPLREFVYLDEVSLRSLLSSQLGEMTDSKSEQNIDAFSADVGSKIAADAQIAKAELTSKFQTSNSSTLQTSRKATVQSWFREFHALPGLRLVEPRTGVTPAKDVENLVGLPDPSVVTPAVALERGTLVEFRVELTADPVFHLGTMVSEFTGMIEDFPKLFQAQNAAETIQEIEPVNKILQRLLAGLIPVRGRATDHVVVTIGNAEYVVHKAACAGLGLDERPLEIVGVTEHLAYWKDIRRVLFSGAVFTVLCRISRDGLHDSWTPVKLADLFQHLAPDLVNQINFAGKLPFMIVPAVAPVPTVERSSATRLQRALQTYAALYIEEQGGGLLSERQAMGLSGAIDQAAGLSDTVSGQRMAFQMVEDALRGGADNAINPARNLALRNTARVSAGLSLFPSLDRDEPTSQPPREWVETEDVPRILDVEVVAIYW